MTQSARLISRKFLSRRSLFTTVNYEVSIEFDLTSNSIGLYHQHSFLFLKQPHAMMYEYSDGQSIVVAGRLCCECHAVLRSVAHVSVCLCVCRVGAPTFERLDLETPFLVQSYIFKISR